jgi:hypothetical protein
MVARLGLSPAASERDSGPVAIGMAQPTSAVVLQADGRLVAFDTAKAAVGKQIYRVPADYHAADVASAPHANGAITCFALNSKSATKSKAKYESFVMQLLPDRRQVWTWLPDTGVYVGVAVDPIAGYAYATNSNNGGVYRVLLGNEKAPVVQVARLNDAERIGAIAIDMTGARLFVADIESGRIYVVPLTKGPRIAVLELPGAEEIRALTWHPALGRLFVADAAQEAVWSIDPDRPQPPVSIRDKRLRAPAGLTVTPDGQLWLVDETARSVFQLSAAQNLVLRSVKWN